MKVVIDTSSLLSLVRYYMPFDKNKTLYNFIYSKIESKEILVLDKVYEECIYTSKGIVVKTLPYLESKKHQINTTDLLPSQKFFNQVENQFIIGVQRNRLTPVQFENEKNKFLNSADAKLLLYSLENRDANVIIVSEETDTSNDNKPFKKLPSICKILDLAIITLPELLIRMDGIDCEFR